MCDSLGFAVKRIRNPSNRYSLGALFFKGSTLYFFKNLTPKLFQFSEAIIALTIVEMTHLIEKVAVT